MRFEFRNFGSIKEVSLEIKPFTLIGGKNQSGKSFILKAIYSILEPIHRTGNFIYSGNFHAGGRSLEEIEKKFRWVFQQDVIGNLVNRFAEEKFLTIKISGKNTVNITIEASSKRRILYDTNELIPDIPIERVNFIPSPVVLDIEKGIATYREFYRNNYGIPDIYWDIIRDIRNTDRADKPELEETFGAIRKVIGGYFKYVEGKGFLFIKSGKKFNMNTVATGIKLLGLLQLLIERNFLKKNTLLIMEEPEVHLHPALRFSLMELLKELANKGVYILISTHSPEIVAYTEYLVKSGKLSKENCSFLFLEFDEKGITSRGISSSSLKILNRMMMSLTEDFFDLTIKELEEFEK